MAPKYQLKKHLIANKSKSKWIGLVSQRGHCAPKNKTHIIPSIIQFYDCLYSSVSLSFQPSLGKVKGNWHIDRGEAKREHHEKVN